MTEDQKANRAIEIYNECVEEGYVVHNINVKDDGTVFTTLMPVNIAKNIRIGSSSDDMLFMQ